MRVRIWQIALILTLHSAYIICPQRLSASLPPKSKGMNEQQIREASEDFTRPWSGRRGIETIDRNAEVILVRVPLDELSDALAARAIAHQRDVMGAEIEVSAISVLAYQLVGHSWSISIMVHVLSYYNNLRVLQSSELAQLSRQLKQPIIRLLVSDTGGTIGYDLFEDGELVEYFRGASGNVAADSNEHGIHPQRYVWFTHPDDLDEDEDPNEPAQTAFFWSRRRQIAAEEMKNIWGFANYLLLQYDAFDPAIDDDYLLGRKDYSSGGKRFRVQNPGITLGLGYDPTGCREEVRTVPDFARVDYFSFGN